MYPSTYLSWFRRLLILGGVVAGLTASAAGARVDPGTPPDVSDVASALSTPASIVSRPSGVRDAATSVNVAAPDVFERYAAAHPYGSGLSSSDFVSTPPDVQDAMTALHTTPEGLKADGLRLQGIARTSRNCSRRTRHRSPPHRPGSINCTRRSRRRSTPLPQA